MTSKTTAGDLAARYWLTTKGWAAVLAHEAQVTATCPVTVFANAEPGKHLPKCGEPVERSGLCAKHAADKDRLS